MKFSSWKTQRRKVLKSVLPIGVFLGLIYLSWTFSYYICWNEIYHHHSKSTGIGLIVGNVLLIIVIYAIWLQISLVGPGVQPHVPLYRLIKDERTDYKAINPPDIFYSDKNGFPSWCSTCQGIKADRTHHSSDMGCCVAKFDHFCSIIGLLIGKKNYRLFMQFCSWFWGYFLYIGVASAAYVKDTKLRHGRVNPNVIVLFIADISWLIMLLALTLSHVYYIYYNLTSIDDISKKNHRRARTQYDQYVNMLYEGKRYVLLINPDRDYIWDKGFTQNWKECMGSNPIFWIIPCGSTIKDEGDQNSDVYKDILGDYYEEISPRWRRVLEERVKSGDYISTFL